MPHSFGARPNVRLGQQRLPNERHRHPLPQDGQSAAAPEFVPQDDREPGGGRPNAEVEHPQPAARLLVDGGLKIGAGPDADRRCNNVIQLRYTGVN